MSQSLPVRIAVVALSFGAAGLVTLVAKEDLVGTAMIPTKNDRWTVGFGSTFRDDGSPVRPGDTITPPQALKRTLAHIEKDEVGLKKCITGVLSKDEYDGLVEASYQYGVAAICKSTMVREINAGNYVAACMGYTEYKYLTTGNPTPGWTAFKFDASGRPIRWRFDCSTLGNKVCRGVWTRNLERQEKCLTSQ